MCLRTVKTSKVRRLEVKKFPKPLLLLKMFLIEPISLIYMYMHMHSGGSIIIVCSSKGVKYVQLEQW